MNYYLVQTSWGDHFTEIFWTAQIYFFGEEKQK